MKKIIRSWVSSHKDRRILGKLKKLLGPQLQILIDRCELLVSECVDEPVYTKVRDLGGVNNLGMLMHYSIKNNAPVAISKIEKDSLAERENRFLQWQKEFHSNTLAAEPFGIISVTENYTCFVSSALTEIQHFSYDKATSLFQRLGREPDLLSHLAIKGRKEALIHEIDDSTNIKSILVHLVSQFDTPAAEVFYKNKISQKEEIFSKEPALFIELQSCMEKAYHFLSAKDLSPFEGLVHGDFKSQNILEDGKLYKVIDCQYYTYGIRLWDLAFLFSKNEKFHNVEKHINKHDLIEEKLFLVFFYLVATIMSTKQKRAEKVLIQQLNPSIQYLKHLLRSK